MKPVTIAHRTFMSSKETGQKQNMQWFPSFDWSWSTSILVTSTQETGRQIDFSPGTQVRRRTKQYRISLKETPSKTYWWRPPQTVISWLLFSVQFNLTNWKHALELWDIFKDTFWGSILVLGSWSPGIKAQLQNLGWCLDLNEPPNVNPNEGNYANFIFCQTGLFP